LLLEDFHGTIEFVIVCDLKGYVVKAPVFSRKL
jgi:hypothetical protein